MVIMQKAVTPQISEAYLKHGMDRVGGFVVRAQDVIPATGPSTPAHIFDVHGLGFPGSPFSAEAPYVDVLRFNPTASMQFENATGGTTREECERTGGSFLDRAPFTGTGFVATRHGIVPLYWLVLSRISPGSELIRVHADGREELLATYVDVGHGWQSRVLRIGGPSESYISKHVGVVAHWHDEVFNADVLDSQVVLVSEAAPSDPTGFEQTSLGRWRRVVDRSEVTELYELKTTALWSGLEMRVVDQWHPADKTPFTMCNYIGHNADLAEGLQLNKIDAGVYVVFAAVKDLLDVSMVQLIPTAWQS